jgi:hypothetical protein
LLLNEDPLVGDISHLQHKSHQEMVDIRYDSEYDDKNLLINNLNQEEWDSELSKLTPMSKKYYYDSCIESLMEIDQFEEGILKLGSSLVFFTDEYSTTDGIKVGDTTAIVLRKLGEPNLKATNRWSYSRGDYLRFHLLIENHKVKYLLLTRPC